MSDEQILPHKEFLKRPEQGLDLVNTEGVLGKGCRGWICLPNVEVRGPREAGGEGVGGKGRDLHKCLVEKLHLCSCLPLPPIW